MDTTFASSPVPNTSNRILQRIFFVAIGGLYSFLVIYTVWSLGYAGVKFPTAGWSWQSRAILARIVSFSMIVVALCTFLSFALRGSRWFHVLFEQKLIPKVIEYSLFIATVLFGIFGVLIKINAPSILGIGRLIGRGFPNLWYWQSALSSADTSIDFNIEYWYLLINFVYWFFVSLLFCAIVITIKYKRT